MEQAQTENSGYGGLSAVDRCVRAPAPTKGLTFRKGKREANVHDVKDGIVFYGVYLDGDDWPAGLYQATLDEWNRLAEQAVEHGAEVFTMMRSNASFTGGEAVPVESTVIRGGSND